MDRRNFIITTAAGAAMLAAPLSSRALSAPMGEEEIEEKVMDLLSRMTLEEKIGQMTWAGEFASQPLPRLGIPGIVFTDGPRGVDEGVSISFPKITLQRLGLPESVFSEEPTDVDSAPTCFPVTMARGATWDPELERRVGEVMGYETRATGANFSGAVCINVLRHPSWGRAQETYGEDPYQLGVMGATLVEALQKHVMACAKHFTANSIEDSRFYVDVRMDERTLRETYLPHFKDCVDAGCASLMSAYNDLNGELCGENRHLLTEILKGDWNFDGFVISDALFAVDDAVAAVNAGLDIELPADNFKKLQKLVEKGKISEGAIDESVSRILYKKLEFEDVGDPAGYDSNKLACHEHTELALEVAQKSMVLLKNENSALPLNREELKTVAVIGELAEMENTGDKGSSDVKPPYVITPLQGITERAGNGITVTYDSGKLLGRAKKIAREADAVVVVAGFTWKDEGENFVFWGSDRVDLSLGARQERLIKAVAEVNDRCVVVLVGSGATTMEKWKDDVPAILMAWYSGMEGGNAIADVLFGDVNPSGKLPHLFPKSTDQLFKFNSRAPAVDYDRYHGYRYFDKHDLEPLFHFGCGLSYTTYEYANLRLDKQQISKDGSLKVSVDVTNTGQVSGEEIVQLYVGYKGSKVDRCVKDLKGFTKVGLDPGQTKTVNLEIRAKDLAFYNESTMSWEVEPIKYLVHAGPSAKKTDLLSSEFEIV